MKCEYNRDGESYWSPYTNKYFPETDEEDQAYHPNEDLRKLEVAANDQIREYAKLYFTNPVTSVYFFESGEDSFGASFLIRNELS